MVRWIREINVVHFHGIIYCHVKHIGLEVKIVSHFSDEIAVIFHGVQTRTKQILFLIEVFYLQLHYIIRYQIR